MRGELAGVSVRGKAVVHVEEDPNESEHFTEDLPDPRESSKILLPALAEAINFFAAGLSVAFTVTTAPAGIVSGPRF